MISQWFMPNPCASVFSRGPRGPLLPCRLVEADLLANIVNIVSSRQYTLNMIGAQAF